MKKILFFGILFYAICSLAFAQDKKETKAAKEPDDISSCFYMRWGPVFPMGAYKTDQYTGNYFDSTFSFDDNRNFLKAKTGFSMELGSHFYTGPAFASKYLRFGIDVTYANLWLNWTDEEIAQWYFFFSQKAGPVLTLSIPGGVMFDFGFKCAPVISRGNEKWGYHFNEEAFVNFDYKLLMISFQYGLGKIDYTDFENKTNLIDITTFRLVFGMKFD